MQDWLDLAQDFLAAVRGGFETRPGTWISLLVIAGVGGAVWALLVSGLAVLHALGLRWRPLHATAGFLARHLLALTVGILAVWAGLTAVLAWLDSPHRTWFARGAWGIAAGVIALLAELVWILAALLMLVRAARLLFGAYRRTQRA